MSKSRFIQHISGQGEKYRLSALGNDVGPGPYTTTSGFVLPSSDYRICESPAQWINITEDCNVDPMHTGIYIGSTYIVGPVPDNYRLSKIVAREDDNKNIRMYVFIVERLQLDEK